MAPRGRSRRSTKNALWPLDLTIVEGFDFNDPGDSDKNTWVLHPSSWLLGLNCPKTSQGVTDQRQNANRSKSNSQIEWGTAAALPNTRRDTALSTQHLLQNTDFSSPYAPRDHTQLAEMSTWCAAADVGGLAALNLCDAQASPLEILWSRSSSCKSLKWPTHG